ncbi:MAG: AsmA family protein, partial [Proteobacteria bacterium]|nr:AsmA family protein [Pseudomonadota bacterium]
EAQMSLIPLAFGIIDVTRIVLVGADILLEVDKKGRANFDFKAPGAKDKPAVEAEQPAEAEGGGALPIPVVREVVIRDSRLIYTDAKAGASHEAKIDELTINGEGPENPIEMLFKGSYNKAGIKMTASLGAPIEVINPTKPYPVELTLEAGGATITVKGSIAEPMAGKGLNLAVSVKGGELGDLSSVAGAEVPKLGAYSMSMGVTGDPATVLNMVGFKGALAGSDVAGDVTVNLKGKRPFINAKLKSKLIDVTAFGGAAGGAAPEAAGEKPPAKPGDRMFPADPLPVEGLRAVDAKLTFDADMIIAAGAKLSGAHVGLSLKGGNLTVAPIKATVAEGAIDGSINLDGRKKAARLAVKLLLSKVNLDTLLTDMQITEDIEGIGNINVDIAGRGTSVAKIMAGLNGRAGVLMGQGRMKTSFLQNMLGGTGQVLNQVLDKGKAGYTVVSCAVIDFPIKKGIATAKAFYIDAEARGIIGTGKINLRDETLDLVVDPRNKKKIGKAVLPVHITGTFLLPDYEIDKVAAATQLTGMLGIELPGALTGAQGGGETPLIEGPCAPPAPAKAAAPAPAPAETAPAIPTTPDEAAKAVEDQIEDKVEDAVKEGLKGLFK